ncbi:hypothetical protein Vafri_17768 [Volvox africanus]|uniref:Uncharacterized protein n=1 Tax=Volvox africanus TaxID=51714 RepID=A0A8J4BL30_9CHLO|nr:hypothetical protein Vafri_17768 [Volvox africanus]
MHQQSSIVGLTTKDLWPYAAFPSCQLIKRNCIVTYRYALSTDGAMPTRADVVATAGAHAQAATAAVAIREARGTRTPAQLADDLYQYATSVNASGYLPGNDAFLTACLSDLSAPHRLRRLRPRQLAILLRSLVRLGAQPGEDWLADLDACCYCHPGPFDPASSTTVLHALAALHTASPTATSTHSTSPTVGPTPSSSSAQYSSAADACAAYWGTAPSHRTQQAFRHRGSGTSHPTPPSSSSPPLLQHTLPQSQRWGQQRAATAGRSPGRRQSSPYPYSATTLASAPSSPADSAPGATFRFPQAVYLRLLQGGVHNYTYDQLATLLQSFRSLGVAVSDELALQMGSRMAALLLEMAPEQRQRALTAVLGGPSEN